MVPVCWTSAYQRGPEGTEVGKRRRQFTPAFRAGMALAASRGREAVQGVGKRHELHPNQVGRGKQQLIGSWPDLFAGGGDRTTIKQSEVKARVSGSEIDWCPRQRSRAQRGSWPYKVRSDRVDL